MHQLISKRSVSAIIPAAGANTRLKEKVAPFLKPTLLIDGEPLIVHAVSFALKCKVESIFTVVSPANASVIHHCIRGATNRYAESLKPQYDSRINYILQPEPAGIVDAIQRCVKFVQTDWTVILCSDNLFREDHHAKIELNDDDHDTPFFASRALNRDQARRFTTYADKLSMPFRGRQDIDSTETCWIGPLLLPTKLLCEATERGETFIPDVLNKIHLTRRIEPYPMQCSDMGIPEEL